MRTGFIKRVFTRTTIQSRLFLLFSISMTGILLIVSVLFYNRMTADFRSKITDLSQKNSSQTVALFNLLLEGYDSLSKSISNNSDVVRMLTEKSESPAVDYIIERSITNVIGAIYYSREDIRGIHVFSFDGKVYNYGDVMSVTDPNYAKTSWFRDIEFSNGKMVWLGSYPKSIVDETLMHPVFSFGRLIYDLDRHKPIGVVLIETRAEMVEDALQNVKLGPSSEAFIISFSGDLVPSIEPPVLPEGMNPKVLAIMDEGTRYEGDQLVVTSRVPFAGWTVISLNPLKELNIELVRTERYLVIVFVVLIGLSILIASLVSRSISSPLKRVVREMKQVETGNFNRVLDLTSYQEIDQLAESFNKMVARIAELIERVKISSVSEKNAELQALQSQVNPHFLYNTLDMIYWLLDEKGHDELGGVLLSLSQMFRYSSHWEEEVTLGEEVEQIRHYLNIIEMRLKGRVSVVIDIDKQWKSVRMPKMTLQPVIENAVKHGLEPSGRSGKLRVYAEQFGYDLRVIVEDDGVGISDERLATLRVSLEEATGPGDADRNGENGNEIEAVRSIPHKSGSSSGGIGIINLQRRLIYMFGRGYGVEIGHAQPQGTAVRITLPLPRLEENELNDG
ncbi:sensor histidine kinase [Cohnella endophytica]|uniref:sensor histidine kinase n=1 Tax=Cohnella endophytica TaxID=2419778 RepID=UPI003898E106